MEQSEAGKTPQPTNQYDGGGDDDYLAHDYVLLIDLS